MSQESKLLSLNMRGIFPGPLESFEEFDLRSSKSKFEAAHAITAKEIAGYPEALCLMKEIFNISPDWIETILNSKGLLPWEGAATWIEELPKGMRSCRIHLKDSLIARWYPKDEMIAHEMVHASRLMFDESRFEEILAYRTSKKWFRLYFGPLFSSPLESKFFLGLLAASWLLCLAKMFWDFNLSANCSLFFPLLALGFGVFRLTRAQRVFSSALSHLAKATDDKISPLTIALRLTDKEIELFSKWTPQEIRSFAEDQKEQNPRWGQLYLCYFCSGCRTRPLLPLAGSRDI
jgi:hypothetical protein